MFGAARCGKVFILKMNNKRNTTKSKRKRNKLFPYAKLKRRYKKMSEETTEQEEKEETEEEIKDTDEDTDKE